jgi:hypothetical protein
MPLCLVRCAFGRSRAGRAGSDLGQVGHHPRRLTQRRVRELEHIHHRDWPWRRQGEVDGRLQDELRSCGWLTVAAVECHAVFAHVRRGRGAAPWCPQPSTSYAHFMSLFSRGTWRMVVARHTALACRQGDAEAPHHRLPVVTARAVSTSETSSLRILRSCGGTHTGEQGAGSLGSQSHLRPSIG